MGDANTVRLNTPDAVRAYLIDIANKNGYSMSTSHVLSSVLGWFGSGTQTAIQTALLEDGFTESYWIFREAVRLVSREYAKIEFPQSTEADRSLAIQLAKNPMHFLHLSKDQPMYVAYTPDANYGKRDRHVKTTVGRYLKKFSPQLSDSDVRRLSDAFKYHFGVEDVLFAETEDDIIRVYTEGPHSCMAHKHNSGNYGAQIHPAAVYASPGLRVAYQMRDGKINARCLIYDNPENKADKRYIRQYGDEVLTRKLISMGYRHATLDGVKLRKLPAVTSDGRPLPGTYVMPYIDDVVSSERRYQGVKVEDDCIVVCHRSSAEFIATSTNGLVGHNASYMRNQNETYQIYDPETGQRALSLEDARYTTTCSCCGSSFRMDNPERQRDYVSEQPVCPRCVDNERGSSRPYVRALVNAQGLARIVRREDATPIAGAHHWVLRDDDLMATLGIMKLSNVYYPGAETVAWRSSLVALDDEEYILVEDARNTQDGSIVHYMQIVSTTRQIKLAKGVTPKKMDSLRVDASSGWLRVVSNTQHPPLIDWFIERAANTQPADRRALLDATFHDEAREIRDLLYSWWDHTLEAHGYSDLINEARQGDLLRVEED